MRWVVFGLVTYSAIAVLGYYLMGWRDQQRVRKEFERIIADFEREPEEHP